MTRRIPVDGPVSVAVDRGRVAIFAGRDRYETTTIGPVDPPATTTAAGHLVMTTWREPEPPADWWTPARTLAEERVELVGADDTVVWRMVVPTARPFRPAP